MDPVDCLLRLLEAMSEEEDAEKGPAATDLLRWLDQGGIAPLGSSGDHPVTTRERTERLRGALRRIARRFAATHEPADPAHELLACANEMNRVAAEFRGQDRVELARDLELQARAGLEPLTAAQPG
jgi:hypothetical protein